MSRQEEEKHRLVIKNNLIDRLQLLEEKMNKFVDPSKIDAQTVFNFYIQQQRIETVDNMTPQNYLFAIEHYEGWYRERNLNFPDPEHLKRIRSYWQGKLIKQK